MPDTGENREIQLRVKAREAEIAQTAKKLLQELKSSSNGIRGQRRIVGTKRQFHKNANCPATSDELA